MEPTGVDDKLHKGVKVPRNLHDAALRRSSQLGLDGFSGIVLYLLRRDLEDNAPELLDYRFTPRRVITSYAEDMASRQQPANVTPLPKAAEQRAEHSGGQKAG